MGIFEKQALLFEGRSRMLFQGYQAILRSSGIRFKAYETEDRVAGGCCGLNSPGPSHRPASRTYSLFVPARELESARALIASYQPATAAEGEQQQPGQPV